MPCIVSLTDCRCSILLSYESDLEMVPLPGPSQPTNKCLVSLYLFLSALNSAQNLLESPLQGLRGVFSQRLGSPAHKTVRPHQDAAVLLDLAAPGPVPVHVLVVLVPANRVRINLNPQRFPRSRCGLLPRVSSRPREDAEGPVAREVIGPDLRPRRPRVDPGVRQPRPRERREEVLEVLVLRVRRPRFFVVEHNGPAAVLVVPLAHLAADGVELGLGAADRAAQGLAARAPARRLGVEFAVRRRARRQVRLRHAQGLPDGDVVAQALVGAAHDAEAHGLPLDAVAREQAGRGVPAVRVRDLPGQVVGVLDARVAAEAVERRVAVDGVAEAEAACKCQHNHSSRELSLLRQIGGNAYMFPFEYLSATVSLMVHVETLMILAGSLLSPTISRTLSRHSSSVGFLNSTVGSGRMMNIHLEHTGYHTCAYKLRGHLGTTCFVHGSTILTIPIFPQAGYSTSGCMTQCKLPTRVSMRWDMSTST